MLTIILLLIFIPCLCHYVLYCNKRAQMYLKVPGLDMKFIVGNTLELILLSPADLFRTARKWAAQFEKIYLFLGFYIAVINIYTPEDIETMISNVKYIEKGLAYKYLKPWLQEGLLLSKGTKWQQRRKILTAAFHFNVLQKYYPTIEDNNQRLVQILEKTNGETVDIVPVISDYTLNTICETAMGTQLQKDTSGAGKSYKEAIHELGLLLIKRFVNLLYVFDFTFNHSPLGKKQSKYISTIRRFTENVIQNRKKSLKIVNDDKNSNEIEDEDNFYDSRKKRKAMLDLLISAEKDGLIDQAGIQEEVDTFMFEGHDTTAAGLTYCLLSLANEQNVQEKAVEELNKIFGGDTRQATMDDLKNMRYLDCCIKESMRLYPPVPFIARYIGEDTVLSDHIIPAGAQCHIHIYDLHRREDLFEKALKFDPDRFLPENSVGRHNYAYIPFSAGPRNCIGQKFAMIEMKSALSAILRSFKLVPVTKHSDLRFVADIILRNSGPVQVQFKKRY